MVKQSLKSGFGSLLGVFGSGSKDSKQAKKTGSSKAPLQHSLEPSSLNVSIENSLVKSQPLEYQIRYAFF
jgi:hypothetical protein